MMIFFGNNFFNFCIVSARRQIFSVFLLFYVFFFLEVPQLLRDPSSATAFVLYVRNTQTAFETDPLLRTARLH